jgi:hypothetical protein
MFNEKYGLQCAAIAGTKPMTRRAVPDKWVFAYTYELVK